MMKIIAAALSVALVSGCCCRRDSAVSQVAAVSPDGKNEIRLWTSPLAYEVVREGVVVAAKTPIALKVNGESLKAAAKCKVSAKELKGTLETPIYKKSQIDLAGRETLADFGTWAVRLVARNDGVAYRFETKMPGKIKVNGECAGLTIPEAAAPCSLNYGYRFGCEETIPLSCKASEIKTGAEAKRQYVYLPFVYAVGGKHVAVTESDVCDYPIWNLKRIDAATGVAFASHLAQWPTECVNNSKVAQSAGAKRERHWRVSAFADYLVETDGTRTFPWRTFILASAPAKFCEADIVTALARGQSAHDFSWVKPGKVAWDWWNAWDNKGEKDGCNTVMYKRFIDFAARAGVEYVILDEGWSEKLNIRKFHPNVDVPEIIRYGNEKGVGIILWMAWAQVFRDEARVAEHFARIGAKGFKVDFMDRGDADCERFLWKFADECAKNRMLVDYHGAHRPTGMSRAYPNVLNYEGVHGLECTKWFKNDYDFPDNDVKQFFLRMTAGPMDYTPGAMDNYPVGKYTGNTVNPGSVGTRCRQMAMMVAYEAPLQMLCDAPAKYERNMECFAFMAATPVVWQTTVGLGGDPDTFAAVARRAKSGEWYAAAINSTTPRDVAIDTAFLGSGAWKVELFHDAIDADKFPARYVHEKSRTVTAGDKITCRMAPGGGVVMKFTK